VVEIVEETAAETDAAETAEGEAAEGETTDVEAAEGEAPAERESIEGVPAEPAGESVEHVAPDEPAA
jgi:hypothetical protein